MNWAATSSPARAAQWDREASFPFANYDDLREAGLLQLCVPEADGGLGADYATYMMVAAEIGRFCGATALTWNMHICSTMWTGVLADGIPMTRRAARRARARGAQLHFERVVKDGAVYAQPFTEGSAAAAGRAPFGTTARKVDGGWLINGRKIFASLSGAADYYGVLCTEDKGDDHPDARDTLYMAVPADARGLRHQRRLGPAGHARHGEPQPDLQGRVRQRRRAAHAARRVLQGRADLAGDVLHASRHLPGPGQRRPTTSRCSTCAARCRGEPPPSSAASSRPSRWRWRRCASSSSPCAACSCAPCRRPSPTRARTKSCACTPRTTA